VLQRPCLFQTVAPTYAALFREHATMDRDVARITRSTTGTLPGKLLETAGPSLSLVYLGAIGFSAEPAGRSAFRCGVNLHR
jgi:hypothetical protein